MGVVSQVAFKGDSAWDRHAPDGDWKQRENESITDILAFASCRMAVLFGWADHPNRFQHLQPENRQSSTSRIS